MVQPEQYKTYNESLFGEVNEDPFSMEDLNEEQQKEKHPHDTKDTASSDKKYSGK
ncbi:hypothetical protein KW850_27125 [Bacillus sp. sid0103]|uniref:hypothetical protein n=1 Tax=Bacillus sp. sid0103 TaxID=2856337 RepID=UPI001C487A24|nr:hypothetical protein [Bacillus sp. sid0103]MBV7508879.1 hypothetical protein [Bacillus sp. sid0103]